jgi:hypothetical protein
LSAEAPGGVTQSARTDLASDGLTGVRPDPRAYINAVAASNLDRQPRGLILKTRRRQKRSQRAIL